MLICSTAVVMHQQRAPIDVVLMNAVGHKHHIVAVLMFQDPAVGRNCGGRTEAVGF